MPIPHTLAAHYRNMLITRVLLYISLYFHVLVQPVIIYIWFIGAPVGADVVVDGLGHAVEEDAGAHPAGEQHAEPAIISAPTSSVWIQ